MGEFPTEQIFMVLLIFLTTPIVQYSLYKATKSFNYIALLNFEFGFIVLITFLITDFPEFLIYIFVTYFVCAFAMIIASIVMKHILSKGEVFEKDGVQYIKFKGKK